MINLRGASVVIILCFVMDSVNSQSQNCANTIPTRGGTKTSEPCIFPFRYTQYSMVYNGHAISDTYSPSYGLYKQGCVNHIREF